MTEKGKTNPPIVDQNTNDTKSACIREDGKIHAVVFKLVAESNMIAKNTPTLWSLVDVMLITQEEFTVLPKFLEDKYGPGLYHLYQAHFDKIHIQDIDQLKSRIDKDIGIIKAVEIDRAEKFEEENRLGSHGFD